MADHSLKVLADEGQYTRTVVKRVLPSLGELPPRQDNVLGQDAFHTMLARERRRAERSRKPFVLMLLDLRFADLNGDRLSFEQKLKATVSNATRETDLLGWYESGLVLAVIFTEINTAGETSIADVLRCKMETALYENLDTRHVAKMVITAHTFPEHWSKDGNDGADLKLYPDLSDKAPQKRLQGILKRAIDVVLSALLLLILSPVFGLIALAIKLTSKGPIIFKQERMGRFGKPFKFLKFRTMYVNNNHNVHREFVQSFIAGKAESQDKTDRKALYKLTKDPRITPIGGFLRRTSLDEFPQFWNVLRGDMSLVGPRPPIPYEFEVYELWHRRRVLEVQPGVTGLWQVTGRSRVSFDDMVRLDLRYSQLWSVWLDFKILLATPRAVLSGDGAG